MRPALRPLGALALLFTLSGAAGLIHEVAWARALGQSLGHSLHALTAVFVAFLGGLGLGAALVSRAARRARDPLRAYARIEIALAAWGAAAPLLILALPEAIERLGPLLTGDASLAALRFTVACAVLMPATLLMGATLPLLIDAALRRGAAPGPAISLLYGANTIGAALGACGGSFFILPLLGTRLTLLAAASLNLIAGAGALLLARRPSYAGAGVAGVVDEPCASAPRRAAGAATVVAAAAVSGTIGAIWQFGWIRVASLAFGTTLYALGTTLTAYILGLGIGPLLVRRWLGAEAAARRAAAGALALAGLASLLILPTLGRLPREAAALAGDRPGLAIVIAAQFALLFARFLPVTAAQGAALPALALLAGGGARGTALVYAASSFGSVAGFALTGFVLLPTLGAQRTLVAAGAVAVALAAALVVAPLPRAPRLRPRLAAAGALCAAALLLASLAARAWDRSQMSGGGFLYGPIYAAGGGRERLAEAMRRRGDLLFYEETGDALVTVRRSPAGTVSLQINGKTEASTAGDLTTQTLAGHLPLLLHPRPEHALVIGLASGITVGAAATHPLTTIETIEIAPVVAAAARLFDPWHGGVLDDPRLTVTLDDARARLLARPRRYDVVTSQPSNPWVAGVSNLFTVEFYRLVRDRLRPRGILCQWIQAYRLDRDDLRGMVAAFLEVFPHATLWEESPGGGDYFLVGAGAPLRVDLDRLEGGGPVWESLRKAGIGTPAELLARFVSGPEGLAAFASGARPHTDDNLYLEWRAPLALLRAVPADRARDLERHRQPVGAILSGADAARRPALLREIAALAAARADRIAILESLGDADREALGDPFLSAGIELLRSGRADEAVAPLARAAADAPHSAVVRLLLAEAYRAAGLDAAATVALEQAVDLDPGLAPAWNALGRRHAAAGRMLEARAAFVRALETARGRVAATARNNLGTILLREGDAREAERLFREAAALDPRLGAAHANLGLVLKRRGDAAGAEAAYRAAIAHDPLDTDTLFNLAVLLKDEGRTTEARAVVDDLLKADPMDDDGRRLRAALRGRD